MAPATMKLPNTDSRLRGPAARTHSICWLAISMMWPMPMTAENSQQARRRRPRTRSPRMATTKMADAEPGGLRVVAAVDEAADADRDQDREDGEGGGDQAEPDDRQVELDGAIGDGDADQRGHQSAPACVLASSGTSSR